MHGENMKLNDRYFAWRWSFSTKTWKEYK